MSVISRSCSQTDGSRASTNCTPRPSSSALHSWDGFSTGRFRGDTLEITTTHLKESYVRRNGVPASFRATVIEHISLEEPFWSALTEIASGRGLSVSGLVAEIDRDRPSKTNLSSAVRVFVLDWYRAGRPKA